MDTSKSASLPSLLFWKSGAFLSNILLRISESTQHPTAITFSTATSGIVSSSSTSSILSSISSPTKAIDELRQRLDHNGYVLQSLITVDDASIM